VAHVGAICAQLKIMGRVLPRLHALALTSSQCPALRVLDFVGGDEPRADGAGVSNPLPLSPLPGASGKHARRRRSPRSAGDVLERFLLLDVLRLGSR